MCRFFIQKRRLTFVSKLVNFVCIFYIYLFIFSTPPLIEICITNFTQIYKKEVKENAHLCVSIHCC